MLRVSYTDGECAFAFDPIAYYGYTVGINLDSSKLKTEEYRIGYLNEGQRYSEDSQAVWHRKIDGDVSPWGHIGQASYVDLGQRALVGGSFTINKDAHYRLYVECVETAWGRSVFYYDYRDKNSSTVSSRRTAWMQQVHRDGRASHGMQYGPTAYKNNAFRQSDVEYFRSLAMAFGTGGWTGRASKTMVAIPKLDVHRILPYCQKLLMYAAVSTSSETERHLYQDALAGQKDFNGNMINFVSKIGGIGTSVRSALALAADPLDPKSWASMWLAGRFSDRLMLRNATQIVDGFVKDLREFYCGKQVSRAVQSEQVEPIFSSLFRQASVEHHARLVCSNKSYTDLMSAVKKLYEWDLYPTLENAWDLVPFSFVVDWFLNVGTILDNIDSMVYNQYLKVELYERSTKVILDLNESSFAAATGFQIQPGQVRCITYHRGVGSIPDLGVLDGWSPSLPSPTNVGDLTALAVQVFL